MIRLFLSVIALLLICCCTEKLPEGYFTVKQLHADLDSLYRKIDEIHPDMFANISKEEFEKELHQIKQSIKKPMDATGFYKVAAPLIVKLKDGHTSLSPDWQAYYDTDKKQFPYLVDIPNDSVILVRRSLSDTISIPVGAQILSINDVSSKELIRAALKYKGGEMRFYRLSKVSAIFYYLLQLNYGFEKFNINYKFDGQIEEKEVEGVSIREIEKNNEIEHKSYSFYIVDNVGILDFYSMLEDVPTFKKFLDSTFRIIKKKPIKDLVIDVRDNTGGNSRVGDELFQYIAQAPFQQFGKSMIKYSKPRADFLRKILKKYYTDFTDEQINDCISNKPFGVVDTINTDELIQLEDNPYRYAGNTYLLTSHHTFSSAGDFAWAFKYFKVGVIVGEETGQPAVSYGDIIYQYLPNTNLKYSVSHKKFYLYGANDNDMLQGTIPDYVVPADKAMDFVFELINKQPN